MTLNDIVSPVRRTTMLKKSIFTSNKRFRQSHFGSVTIQALCLGALTWYSWLGRTSVVAPFQSGNLIGRVTVVTVGPRALRDALSLLGSQLHCAISYEDPPYKYPSTIQLLTPDGPRVPSQRRLFFTYDPQRSKREIIQELLEEYHKVDDSVVFKLTNLEHQNEDVFNVAPVEVKDQDGRMTTWTSPLENKISVTTTDNYYATAARITELATQNSTEEVKGVEGLYRNPLSTEKISLIADNKSARSCLNKLIQNFNAKHSSRVTWNVLRDPNLKDAFLSFQAETHEGMEATDSPLEKRDSTITVHSESNRPLVDVLQVIGQQTGENIVFEDTPYLCSCSIMRDRAGNSYAPRGGILNFIYSVKSEPIQVLADATESFNKENAGKFVVKRVGEVFYVHPTEFINEKEEVLPYKPLLKTPITILVDHKPAIEVLKNFCEVIADQTKQQVVLGKLPASINFGQPLSYSATGQPAIKCLSDIGDRINPQLSWQLLYEPRTKVYMLNPYILVQRGSTKSVSPADAVKHNEPTQPTQADADKLPLASEKPAQRLTKIHAGDTAPDFSVPDMNGQMKRLSDYKGKNHLLLTFFPKCFTGGCTNHLSSLRDVQDQLSAANVQVIAVSVDPAEGEHGQKAFAKMWNFQFPLIPDTDRKLSLLYGAVNEPTELDQRMSVLIDKQGIVRWIDTDVHVRTHGADMLAKIKELNLDR